VHKNVNDYATGHFNLSTSEIKLHKQLSNQYIRFRFMFERPVYFPWRSWVRPGPSVMSLGKSLWFAGERFYWPESLSDAVQTVKASIWVTETVTTCWQSSEMLADVMSMWMKAYASNTVTADIPLRAASVRYNSLTAVHFLKPEPYIQIAVPWSVDDMLSAFLSLDKSGNLVWSGILWSPCSVTTQRQLWPTQLPDRVPSWIQTPVRKKPGIITDVF